MMDQSESFIAERKSKLLKEMKEILRKEPNQLIRNFFVIIQHFMIIAFS